MLLVDNFFVCSNKVGEVSTYDIRKLKNPLKKFHVHLGAVKDLKIDENSLLYSSNIKSWFRPLYKFLLFERIEIQKQSFCELASNKDIN